MAQQTINLGTPNAQNGDSLRAGGDKINDNFTEVYTNVNVIQNSLTNISGSVVTNQTGIAALSGRVDLTEGDIDTLQSQMQGLLHVPMLITSFTNTVGTVEIGSTVTSITFNWAVNKTPATLSINQGIGSITPTLTTLTTAVNLTADTTYTLTANDGTSYPQNIATATTTVAFRHKAYWGISASTSLNSAGILSLASSAFTTSRARTFTIDGNGQYIYYAYPASFGDATFTVNGLLSTAWTKTVVTFINASGNSTSFNVYRSDTIQNGTGIQISVA